tara:strand:- start:2303 stop:2848 length:546 start_codon:yes stop_codon:yes gene_type:complete
MIHPSHSRRDLVEVCEIFNIEIEDVYDLTKVELVKILLEELDNISYIDPEMDYFFVQDIDSLKRYLSEPNQSKNITVSTKEKNIKDARRIISYCQSGFNLFPHFKNQTEVYTTGMDISQHCDISTCRRAIKLLNEDRSLPHKIEPIISNRIRKQIERKEAVKRKTSGKYLKRTGKFQITFT